MLVELRIRDFAVIDEISLELGAGLNALSGETGAGKSILVGALSLLVGERASSEVVRAGTEKAVVEGVFEIEGREDLKARLDALGIDAADGYLILRREVQREGRNRAWVNGSPTTATTVGELGTLLVDLHGQHEHQTLLRPAAQRDILDAFAEAEAQVEEVSELHGRLRDLRKAREERESRARELEARADFLRFQLGEIEEAAPEPGEDETLENEAGRLEHSEELASGAGALANALYSGDGAVADHLAQARDRLAKLARLDGELEELASALNDGYHLVAETGRRLDRYAGSVDHDPGRLDQIRRRLDLLKRLTRKYGPTLEGVLATRDRIRAEVEELDTSEFDLEQLRKEEARAQEALSEAAERLGRKRREAAGRLVDAVEEILPDLGLPGAVFRVEFRERDEVGAAGREDVEFLVSLNPGFEPRALRKVASGGELSRVMLVLKTVLTRVDRVSTLIFDEIDAGIGGVVATRVAEKLAEVARGHQVFVITHLPQLASRADAHLFVEKGEEGGLALTRVRRLDGDVRVREIARMLGGDPESSASRKHAEELLGV